MTGSVEQRARGIRAVASSALFVIALASLLTSVSVAGTFTIDESNYMATVSALRAGSIGLPGTHDVPASPEWYAFDPFPPLRGPPRTPIIPTAPPLYAPFALLFAPFGLRGLIFLNALSFALAIVLVHRAAAAHARTARTGLFAAAVFALGSYSIEYAQGIWPHMLSVALVMGAVLAASRARREGAVFFAVVAGMCAAAAAGVRYQNVVVVIALGVGLLLAAPRRVRTSAAFAAGAALPILVAAFINLRRLGIFNPVTKGVGYIHAGAVTAPSFSERVADAALSFWTRVVDFSVHPPIGVATGDRPWMADPELGVFFAIGAVKKALLQSAPWAGLGLVLLAAAWWPRGEVDGQRREARALALVVGAVLLMFTVVGTGNHDGLCFNSRYLLELLPLAAISVAWWLERADVAKRPLLLGALVGAVLCVPVGLSEPYSLVRSATVRFLPLALAAALLVAALLVNKRRGVTVALLAASVTWAFGLHLIEDLPASRRVRAQHADMLAAVREALPKDAALLVYGPSRDALWPVFVLDGVFVLDPAKDGGRDAPGLIREMISRGRRVFVYAEPFPKDMVAWMAQQARASMTPLGGGLVELSSPATP